MSNFTESEIEEHFSEIFPDRTVIWSVLCDETSWYLFAPSIDLNEGDLNPYFIIDDVTGDLSEFYVVQNLAKFQEVLDKVLT